MNFQKVQTSGSMATALRPELLEGGQPGTLQSQGSHGREAKRNRASGRGDVRARRSLCREVGHLLGRMRVAQMVKNPPAMPEAQV